MDLMKSLNLENKLWAVGDLVRLQKNLLGL